MAEFYGMSSLNSNMPKTMLDNLKSPIEEALESNKERVKKRRDAFEALSSFRSEELNRGEKLASRSDTFFDLAKSVDVGNFMGAPVYTGGRDLRLSNMVISAGLGGAARGATREGSKISVFDEFRSADSYMDELEKSRDPFQVLIGNVGRGLTDVLGSIGQGLGFGSN